MVGVDFGGDVGDGVDFGGDVAEKAGLGLNEGGEADEMELGECGWGAEVVYGPGDIEGVSAAASGGEADGGGVIWAKVVVEVFLGGGIEFGVAPVVFGVAAVTVEAVSLVYLYVPLAVTENGGIALAALGDAPALIYLATRLFATGFGP